MKVLLATQKPFAAKAVEGIESILKEAGHEVEKLEKYESQEDLIAAAADAEAMIIRSDKVTPEVQRRKSSRSSFVPEPVSTM